MKKSATPQTLSMPKMALRAIYLRESNTAIRHEFDPLIPGQRVQIHSRFSPVSHSLRGTDDGHGTATPTGSCHVVKFLILYFLGEEPLSIDALPDDSEAVALITADFAAEYLFAPDQARPTDEQLMHWSQGAVLHIWPYWREFCHASMLRMSLPVIMVPLLSMTQAEPVATPSKADAAPKRKAARKKASAK